MADRTDAKRRGFWNRGREVSRQLVNLRGSVDDYCWLAWFESQMHLFYEAILNVGMALKLNPDSEAAKQLRKQIVDSSRNKKCDEPSISYEVMQEKMRRGLEQRSDEQKEAARAAAVRSGHMPPRNRPTAEDREREQTLSRRIRTIRGSLPESEAAGAVLEQSPQYGRWE